VNGDGPSSLSKQPTCTTTATSSSPASPPTYSSNCSGASSSRYVIFYVSGTVTINPAPLTITASSATVVYGSALPPVTPIYSGFVNGDTPASLTTPPVCTVTGVPSGNPAGTYTTSCARGGREQLDHQLPPWKLDDHVGDTHGECHWWNLRL